MGTAPGVGVVLSPVMGGTVGPGAAVGPGTGAGVAVGVGLTVGIGVAVGSRVGVGSLVFTSIVVGWSSTTAGSLVGRVENMPGGGVGEDAGSSSELPQATIARSAKAPTANSKSLLVAFRQWLPLFKASILLENFS